MWRPKRWLLGVPPLLLLAALSGYLATAPIENRILDQAATAIGSQGWATAAVDGRDVVLSGESPSVRRSADAVEALAALPGIRRIVAAHRVLAEQASYLWTARREGAALTLEGFAPSMEARSTIVAAARTIMPAAELRDGMRLAAGAPPEPQFLAAVERALALLGELEEGRATLAGLTLSVEGRARETGPNAAFGRGWAALPDGVVPGRLAIAPPRVSPFRWSAERRGTTVRLQGVVPSADVAAALRTAAAMPGVTVEDGTSVADGAPAEFGAAARFALRLLALLGDGSVALADATLEVTGRPASPGAHEQLRLALASPPAGLRVADDTRPALVAPYEWRLEREPAAVVLRGGVPSEAARGGILAALRTALPGVAVRDAARLADGAPDGFADTAILLAAQLRHLRRGSVGLEGGAFVVSGEPVPGGEAALRTAVAALPGVRLALDPPPRREPLRLSAELTGRVLVLAGTVPDEAVRAAILDRARAAGLEPTDRLAVVPAEPDPAYADTAATIVAQLARLARGRAAIADGAATLEGEGRDAQAFEAAVAAARQPLPAGYRYGRVDVLPPAARPYLWTASRDAQTVTLSGVVPSGEVRRLVLAAARERAPGAAVFDQMRLASGAPQGDRWIEAARFALDHLGRLRVGRVTLQDGALSVSGEAIGGRPAPGGPPPGIGALSVAVAEAVPDVRAWWANRRDGVVTLAGAVAPQAREGLLAAARQRFPRDRIIDELRPVDGGVSAEAANAAFALLARLEWGRASLRGGELRLEGAAANDRARAEAEQAAARVRAVTAIASLRPLQP